MPAMIGGGNRVRPGEVSLAHNGVLFVDELSECSRQLLESLRQPLESGKAVIARANAHVTYPARFQFVAAMNPCRCGHLGNAALACSKAPRCAEDYLGKLSGPLLDRIDIHIEVPPVSAADLTLPPPAEGSREVAARVAAARKVQEVRYAEIDPAGAVRLNSQADGEILAAAAALDEAGRDLMGEAVERMHLSARGYHRILRVARTLADLDGVQTLNRAHIAEALSYRQRRPIA